MRGFRFALAFLFLTTVGFGAEVVKTTIVPDSDRGNPNPQDRVEITQISFGPGEEALIRALLNQTAQEAFAANPQAVVDVLLSGGSLTAEEASQIRESLSVNDGRPNFSIEAISGGSGNTHGTRIHPGEPGEPTPPATVPTGPQPSDWKGALTLIRTVSSGVTVGVTAWLSKGASLEEAAMVGTAAGLWAGFWQWRNRERLNWQAHRNWLGTSPPEEHERAGVVKRFIKRAILSGAYSTMMNGAYFMSGLNTQVSPVTIGLSVAENLYVQTFWEALNQQWTEAAIRRDPNRKYLYSRLSSIGTLVQSILSTATYALNAGHIHIGGVHVGSVVAGTLGTAGLLVYGYTRLPESVHQRVRDIGSAILGSIGLCGPYFEALPKNTQTDQGK